MRLFFLSLVCLAILKLDQLHAQEGQFKLTAGAISGGFLSNGSFGNYFNESQFGLSYEESRRNLSFSLNLGLSDGEYNLDGSFIERKFGPWVLGYGSKNRNWGPSKFSSLVLSNNARPVESIYFSRERSSSNHPWLSWAGEWYGDLMVGELGGHTRPENPKLIGMRLGFNPISNMDVELVRMIQWGGAGRDNSVETFWRLLAAIGDPNHSNVANQLAGLSVSYTFPIRNKNFRTYIQAVGEDASGYIPSCWFYLAGIETELPDWRIPTKITLERVDTRVERTPAGFCGPGTAYRNGFYEGGYTNFGSTMGVPIDTEGHSLSLYVEHQLRALELEWSVGYYDINDGSHIGNHRLTSPNAEGFLVTVGFNKSLDRYDISGVIAYQSFQLNSQNSGLSLGLSVVRSF